MVSNFKIFQRRKNDRLYLKLLGDFDGSSAFELVNVLKKSCKGVNKVIINTTCLKNIYPFGRDVFQKNLYHLSGLLISILFTGKNSTQIMSENLIYI